jgi:hypothetical protein
MVEPRNPNPHPPRPHLSSATRPHGAISADHQCTLIHEEPHYRLRHSDDRGAGHTRTCRSISRISRRSPRDPRAVRNPPCNSTTPRTVSRLRVRAELVRPANSAWAATVAQLPIVLGRGPTVCPTTSPTHARRGKFAAVSRDGWTGAPPPGWIIRPYPNAAHQHALSPLGGTKRTRSYCGALRIFGQRVAERGLWILRAERIGDEVAGELDQSERFP